MNLILLKADDFTAHASDMTEGRVRLSDERAQHIIHVLRAQAGDALRCGMTNGLIGSARISAVHPSVELEVTLNIAPPAKLPLTLLLALPRPKVARRIIRTATEMGVEEIILLNTYRVEKSYWQSPLVDDQHLYDAMLEGLSQSGDTVLPKLRKARGFKPFVEDELPSLLEDKTGLLAHPYANTPAPGRGPNPCLLALGPEGGFIPYEIEKLSSAGLNAFHLGARILKVETAVPALIARLFL